jgi:hypothetical protein
MAPKKSSNLNVKLKPLTLEEFSAAARVRGATIIHNFVVKTIKDAKEHDPAGFAAALEEIRRERVEASKALKTAGGAKAKPTTARDEELLPQTRSRKRKEYGS